MLVFSLFYGALNYVQYLCFVALIALWLCVEHAYILMLVWMIICFAMRSLQSFLYDSCAQSQGEKFYLVHIYRGRKSQGRYIYQGGKDIFFEKTLFCFMLVFSLFYGALSYVQYLCFVALIALDLCVGHAYILMLLCFIDCMFR